MPCCAKADLSLFGLTASPSYLFFIHVGKSNTTSVVLQQNCNILEPTLQSYSGHPKLLWQRPRCDISGNPCAFKRPSSKNQNCKHYCHILIIYTAISGKLYEVKRLMRLTHPPSLCEVVCVVQSTYDIHKITLGKAAFLTLYVQGVFGK